MTREEINQHRKSLPGAEVSDPWGGGHDAWKVGGKMFASIGAITPGVSVKTDSIETAEMLISAGVGEKAPYLHRSWILLPFDAPEEDHCGTCRACLDICPTRAFPQPYQLDARRCLAYLSIEHKGPIPIEFRALMGNRIFGCDDCLAVCPWNKFAGVAREARLATREELQGRPLVDLAGLDDPAFRALFAGTPVKRTGRDRFVRNVLIAIGHSGAPALAAAAEARLEDESPLVRGAAVWALSRLDPARFAALKIGRADAERDPDVGVEWQANVNPAGPG
jgi:epoxyqueuosine reductase